MTIRITYLENLESDVFNQWWTSNADFFHQILGASEPYGQRPSQFRLDGGDFNGIGVIVNGDFTYRNGNTRGDIDNIRFTFGAEEQVIHRWDNLGWDAARAGRAIDGTLDDFLAFLGQTTIRHIIDASSVNAFVHGFRGSDFITAQTPDDIGGAVVFTHGGRDIILLGRLNGGTYVDSGVGRDRVITGSGDDQIRSQGGNDLILGGGGSDNIDGQSGNDRVLGQGGDDDYLTGGRGNDVVHGNQGDDYLTDNRGNNRLFGDAGDDQINGRGRLDGGAGNDSISGRGHIIGGAGNDQLAAQSYAGRDVLDFRLGRSSTFGDDTVTQYSYDYYVGADPAGRGQDQLWFDEGVDVSFHHNGRNGDVFLTARLAGVQIGQVRFDTNVEASDAETLNSVLQRLEDDLVFF